MIVRGVEGGRFVSGREYLSRSLGLVGRPDAVVEEGGYFVPIERKSFGKRPRDKDIAQLLVYCRLIEEESGVRPPHGYLIIGPQAKRFKVVNSAEKQLWIDTCLEQMRAVLAGGACVATPDRKKCDGCAVRERCTQRAKIDWLGTSGILIKS
jgi:CRISPR-associated protein Cas4